MSSFEEQVIDFHYELFDRVFTLRFRPKIKERLKQDAVARQVQEAAGAASQALTRFFLSEQLTQAEVAEILNGLRSLYDSISLERIANPNDTPEALVEELTNQYDFPLVISESSSRAVYRVALHQTIQVLMLVGPVMTEWQTLSFASTYEMPRRIVSKLNEITDSLKTLTSAGRDAADERYELAYRDHLLQRFYRVEAGTVKMTTNRNVDLRELFVMPRLKVRAKTGNLKGELGDALMDLSAARAIFAKPNDPTTANTSDVDTGVQAIEQIRRSKRNVVVGVPGSGKSTFFEWLQLSVANVDEELISGGGQAIPLLLRVRQLDAKDLPRGAELIEKATASRDRATLMPPGWIDRQMKAGRVLFMLDGLDEAEPSVRDRHIFPWFSDLCEKYPDCLFLVSSRPVGYSSGDLEKLKFEECDLQDFGEPEIGEYTRHWCTAIRLAQNEPDEEARQEGAREGGQIVSGFKGHPYIRDLARNPLMLSAICLVNYFEGGQLPKDRAVLYRLCVEGLLHHWDQRRGIRSEYSLDEKLRVCREVAIAMQSHDRAEFEAEKVFDIFAGTLKNKERARQLLEHIRYRTGLLIERRANVFAFAHLTFQEYLAASGVYEGNHLRIEAHQLMSEHADGRWNEVIALYCGLASTKLARKMLEDLVKQPDTLALPEVLAEAYVCSNSEILRDQRLRKAVLKRVAISTGRRGDNSALSRFPVKEVKQLTNAVIGTIGSEGRLSVAFEWLMTHPDDVNVPIVKKRLERWRNLNPFQVCELLYLVHLTGSDELLDKMDPKVYKMRGPAFTSRLTYGHQAEVAMLALGNRYSQRKEHNGPGTERAMLSVLRVLAQQITLPERIDTLPAVFEAFDSLKHTPVAMWPEYVALCRRLANRILSDRQVVSDSGFRTRLGDKRAVSALRKWANKLERAIKVANRKENFPHLNRRNVTVKRKNAKSSKRKVKR